MSTILDQLRNKFKNEEKTSGGNRGNQYAFWNLPFDGSSTIRFLPDKNPDNPMLFMVEKKTHKLEINGENKTVPCLSMYGEECPICQVSRAYYKQGDEVQGKKFYRKLQHVLQALIIKDGVAYKDGEEPVEGQIKILTIDFKIYNIIKNAFTSGDLEEVPFAYEGGTNFIITKSQQGKWADYSLSKFARRSTDLTEDQIEFCQENIVDLSTLLPAKPDVERVEAMLTAALTGEALADEPAPKKREEAEEAPKPMRRMPKFSDEADDNPVPRAPKRPVVEEAEEPPKPARRPVVEEEDEEEDVRPRRPAAEVDDTGDEEADEILASIRRRRAQRSS